MKNPSLNTLKLCLFIYLSMDSLESFYVICFVVLNRGSDLHILF